MGQIEFRQGKLSDERRIALRRIASDSASLDRFCALVVLGKPKEAVDLVEQKSSGGFLDEHNIKTILSWPLMELVPDKHTRRLQHLCH